MSPPLPSSNLTPNPAITETSPPSPTPLTIRPFQRSDIPNLTTIFTTAFHADELFLYIEPGRNKFPLHARGREHRAIHILSNTPGTVISVATLPPGPNNSNEEIVGFGIWCRRGTSPTARGWQRDSLAMKVERTLWNVAEHYHRYAGLDHATDYKREDEWVRYIEQKFYHTEEEMKANRKPEEDDEELWHLDLLAVASRHQRKGIGGRIVMHGLERAKEERVDAQLEGSFGARACYERCGFVVQRKLPFAEGVQGWQMRWLWNNWYKQKQSAQ